MNLRTAGLTQNDWGSASPDQRLVSLQELENQLSDQQQRHTCEIRIYPGNPSEYGYYSAKDPEHLYLNESLLEDASSLKAAVETVAHEGRHAYQDHCICYPQDHPEIDQARIDLWRDNFANYIPADVDYAKYRSQPIEVDAFDFEVSISEALNIPNLSRSAMPAQEHKPDPFQRAGNRRKAPPAREDGPTFVTPSSDVPVKRETVTGHNLQESRLHDHHASSSPVSQTELIPRDPEQAFSSHAEQLQQRYGFGLDRAKADGIIALKMAQTGWQPEEVTAALTTSRLNTDLPAHDVPAYAEKLTVQAFQKAGKEAAFERNDAMDLGR